MRQQITLLYCGYTGECPCLQEIPAEGVRPAGTSDKALCSFFFKKKIFFNVRLFLRETERQNMSGGGAEREGDTESGAGSGLRAVSTEPDAGLEPTNREILT